MGLALLLVLTSCGSQEPETPPAVGVEKGKVSEVETGGLVPAEPAPLVGKFITSVGKHVVDADGRFEIHVVRDGGFLNYKCWIRTVTDTPGGSDAGGEPERELGSKTGPKKAVIDPDSKWFIYVESAARYWIFDGGERVTLYEYTESSTESETKMTGLASAPKRLLAEMPASVKDRIPPAVLAETK